MNYNHLSKDELLSKIEKLEHDLSQYKSSSEKLKKAEEKIKQQSLILKFINSMAIPSADKSAVEEFTKILIKAVKDYTGAVLAVFNYYDSNKKELVLLHIEAEQDMLKTALKIAGKKILKTTSPVNEETYKLIIENTVYTSNTFTEVSFGAIPAIIDKAIRKSTRIDRLYPVAHVIEGELYGTTLLGFKKGQTSPSIELLEAYANIMSVSLRRYNAEKALRNSEIKHRLYIEHSPLGIFVVDNKGNYIDINPGVCELLGYSQSELLKLSIQDISTSEESRDNFQKLKKEGKLSYETRLKKKDGSIVDVRLDAVTLRKNEFMAFATDITERKLAEESIKRKETKYKNLVETASDAIYLMTENGNIIDCNQAACEMLQKSKNEIIGSSIASIDPSSPIDEFLKFWKKVPFNKQYIFETSHLRKDGTLIPIEISSKKYKLNDEIFYYAVARDITERKESEKELLESEEKFRELFHNAADAIFIADIETGILVDANETASQLILMPHDQIVGMHQTQLHPVTNIDHSRNSFNRQYADSLQQVQILPIENEVVRSDGSLVPVEILASTITIKSKPYLMGIFRNISLRKQAKEELIKAKEKAEESDRLKSAFLANMSHEIRTPMNGIIGFTNLLKEPGLSSKEQERYIDIIEKSGDRMLTTINDIIDISKIEAGQVDVIISDINLRNQLNELFEFFLPEAKKKNIKLSITKRGSNQLSNYKSDKEKLNSILTNLIKNAIKYSHSGSIDFGYNILEKGKQNELKFYVNDKGIGIPKDRQNAIFNRFEQADIEDRQVFEGSGLGLAISKAYVEMLGGKIWVESEEGVGSQFCFTIPLNKYNKPNEVNNTKDFNKKQLIKKGLKVLIVDDDEFVLIYLSKVLEEYNKEMLIAKTGIEAVEICRDNPDIDIVLMDIKIPKIDGYEATRQIRKFNKKVFILAQTAYAQAGYREKAIEAGCNEYIAKPINKEKLLEIISNQI